MISTRTCSSESHYPTVDPSAHEALVHETVQDRRDGRVGVVRKLVRDITNRKLVSLVIPEDSNDTALEVS
jgi:hypothetical protein